MTTQVGRCGRLAPTKAPVVCVLPSGHTGWHRGSGDNPAVEWTTPGDSDHVERLETGIAAAVHEIDELRAENTRLRTLVDCPELTTLHTNDHLKTVREALCVAQAAIGNFPNRPTNWPQHIPHLQRLIDDIDRQRPLGSNGKHGNLHTPVCQCEDTA